MQVLATSILLSSLSLGALMYSRWNIRIIKMNNLWDKWIWTYRAARAKHPLPQVMEDWDSDSWLQAVPLYAHWKFLGPFFASHGYTLYNTVSGSHSIVPPPFPLPATDSDTAYPYSRRFFTDDEAPFLTNSTTRVWGARDQLGRDVVIKVVSEVKNPSDEFKILKRLNEPELRSDPHNHTIYSIEFLTFDDFVFVIMPRWDCAVLPHLCTVSELMEFGKAMLEALAFLHRHRIVHHDPIAQNIGMNAIFQNLIHTRPGLRDQDKVQYALFDFGYSVMYPTSTDLDEAETTRFLPFPRGMSSPQGPFNPFKADVAIMGATLQTRIRHIENKIPELGPFFERMTDENERTRPSAQGALTAFLAIYSKLTEAQLMEEVTTHMWKIGGIVTQRTIR